MIQIRCGLLGFGDERTEMIWCDFGEERVSDKVKEVVERER